MKRISTSVIAAAVFAVCSGLQAHAAPVLALPAANCGTTQANNCVQYGNFSVYSLGLLYTQAVFGSTGVIPTTNPNPGDPFYVKSAPGELGNPGYIVYGTGTNNQGVVTNGAGTLIDDAQQLPTGGGALSPYATGAGTETAPAFAGDTTTKWDGTLSAVRSELGAGGQFITYFNLNETGNDGLAGLDLLAWLHVTLVDVNNGLVQKDYYLGGSTAPSLTNIADPNWVTVHGTICVSATAGFLGFGPCNQAQKNAGGKDVNQNLGANTAAFAIFNQELSDLVLNSNYDFIRVEGRLSQINNGYEQIFSALSGRSQKIPEPGSLPLLGVALGGIALAGLKRLRREA